MRPIGTGTQGAVAGEEGQEILSGQQTGEQAHRGPAVAGVQQVGGFIQMRTESSDSEAAGVVQGVYGNPHGLQTGRGGPHVPAVGQASDRGGTVGDSIKNERPMGDGFVAGHGQRAGQPSGSAYGLVHKGASSTYRRSPGRRSPDRRSRSSSPPPIISRRARSPKPPRSIWPMD